MPERGVFVEYFEDLSNQLEGLVSSVIGADLGGVLGAIIIGWVLVLAFQFVCFPFAIWRIRREVINKNNADNMRFAELFRRLEAIASDLAVTAAKLQQSEELQANTLRETKRGNRLREYVAEAEQSKENATAKDDPDTLALIAALEAKNKN